MKEIKCWRCNKLIGYSQEEVYGSFECEECYEFLKTQKGNKND